MMKKSSRIKLNLYGKLRRFAPDTGMIGVSSLGITLQPNDTVASVLARLGIEPDQIYTVFVNSKLLATRNNTATIVEMIQVDSNPHTWDLNLPLHTGDRLGIFGEDMAILV
jgi:hypothetical protein